MSMNQPIIFVHTADLHLDVPFSLRRAEAGLLERCRMERRDLFRRIIDVTVEQKAHLLLIAGDLFEHAHVRRSTIAFIQEQLCRLEQTRVFIAPGNHDPLLPDSYYQTVSWPEHVHIFRDQWEAVSLPEWNVVVHGWGFSQYEVNRPVMREAGVVSDRNTRHMAVLHGTMMGFGGGEHSPYLPITLEEIETAGFSYVALGHIHKHRPYVDRNGRVRAAYPGTPEGSRFSETGEKGILLGQWSDELSLSFEPMGGREYMVLVVELDGCQTEEEIVQRTLSHPEWQEATRRGALIRLKYNGRIHPELKLSIEWLEARLKEAGAHYIECVNETAPNWDWERLAEQPDGIGEFVREVRRRIEASREEAERRRLEKALLYGIEAWMTGGVVRK
jgi:exonuclease SbcD